VAAKTILGISYLEGSGVDVNYDEAFRLLSEAAAQGASRAIVYLASMYAEGRGVPANALEAIRLYEVSAKAGEFFSQIELGRIFAQGIGIPADPISARKWYSVALQQADRVKGCDPELHEAKIYVTTGVITPPADE
jgi:TPR repeat protein